jgi:hypothetical protein
MIQVKILKNWYTKNKTRCCIQNDIWEWCRTNIKGRYRGTFFNKKPYCRIVFLDDDAYKAFRLKFKNNFYVRPQVNINGRKYREMKSIPRPIEV